MMHGYDLEKAIAFMTPKFDTKEFKPLAPQLTKLLPQIIQADMDFMQSSGVLDAEGMMGDAYYDDDAAFEYLLEKLAKANRLPDNQINALAALIDQYMDLQEAFLSENGMMDWE